MNHERLSKIANLVDENSIVGDIGTDHGLIPIFLSENKFSKKIIASDISEKSLSKLVEKVEENPYISNIETRVSDGLNKYKPFEVDTFIISGMGGYLILKIIDDNIEIAKTADTMILQGNNSLYELRKYLHANGFKIVEEDDVTENDKYYQIIKTKVGIEKYNDEAYYHFGKILINKKSENLKVFLDKLISTNIKLLNNLVDLKSENVESRIEEIKDENKFYESVRRQIEN